MIGFITRVLRVVVADEDDSGNNAARFFICCHNHNGLQYDIARGDTDKPEENYMPMMK